MSADTNELDRVRSLLARRGPGNFEGPYKLALTYDNAAMTDGVGAQLQRILGIYAVSRLLGVPYVHSPLARADYQGLAALETNAVDPAFHQQFNDLLQIGSDVELDAVFSEIRLSGISVKLVQLLVTLVDIGRTAGKPGLVRLAMPYGIADRFPDCYEVCTAVSPFEAPAPQGRPLRVALHVRRGEQVVVDSDRILPNAYFIEVAQGVARVLDDLGLDYSIELWTEVPRADFVVHPDHPGIANRIGAPVMIGPSCFPLDDFDVLTNLVHCVNGRATACLQGLATADILVMSRSSFSYVAAILNRRGAVLYHPFWHSPLSAWIIAEPDGSFDHGRLSDTVTRWVG